jgi:hypothetical protein
VKITLVSVILILMLSGTVLSSILVGTSDAATLPKTGIAMAKQSDTVPSLTTGLIVGIDGALYVTWMEGGKRLNPPVAISPKGIFPPGAGIAMTKQTNDMLSALAVGNNGAIHGSWVVGTGKWNGPVPLSPPNFAPPGAGIAMAKQTDITTTALTVGNNGALHVSWVDGTGAWNFPKPISPPNFAPPGAPIAMAKQTANTLTALTIGNNGALHVSWVDGTGEWKGPVPISQPNYAKPGSPLAMARQTDNILSAITIDKDGAVNVSWVVGTGGWKGPVAITPKGIFPDGVPIGMSQHIDHHYDGETYTIRPSLHAYVQKNDGTVYEYWVQSDGIWSKSPRQLQNIFTSVISNQGLFPPGAGVANAETTDRYHPAKKIPHNQYITLFVNKDGTLLCEPKHICEPLVTSRTN